MFITLLTVFFRFSLSPRKPRLRSAQMWRVFLPQCRCIVWLHTLFLLSFLLKDIVDYTVTFERLYFKAANIGEKLRVYDYSRTQVHMRVGSDRIQLSEKSEGWCWMGPPQCGAQVFQMKIVLLGHTQNISTCKPLGHKFMLNKLYRILRQGNQTHMEQRKCSR